MRYILICEKLADNHPLWPGESVYRIKDLNTGYIFRSCYTNIVAAEKMLSRRISR